MSKIELLEIKFKEIMEILELDLNDDSLKDTPKRLAKLYGKEIFKGLTDPRPKTMAIENKFDIDEMITVDKIRVNSTCEHHFLPFFGFAKISYIPKSKVIGLSKLNRLVEWYSKRPQVQERLTVQLFNDLKKELDTDNIAIMINATHTCVKTRGIEDQSSYTKTTKLGGVFKDQGSAREEFLS